MPEPPLPADIKADIELAVNALHNELGENILKIILFGSCAKGTYQPDSDIDLAVVLADMSDPKKLLRCKRIIELDRREVDFLFCSEDQLVSNKFVYKWINEHGVVLYEKL